MKKEEKILKIKDIYNKVLNKIKDLGKKQKDLSSLYIKKLEEKKIEQINKSLLE